MVDQVPSSRGRNRDIVVIGASAGGLEALKSLVKGLPEDLPAAVFVVMHMGPTSHLPAILNGSTRLDVAAARNGERVEHGRVYVATPDRHLLLHDDHVLLRRGARENLSRPAIDPLFRTAALSFGGRVTGVVLSGSLNDGTAGLHAVKAGGGVAVVQDPANAEYPEMPDSALRHVNVDHVVPAHELAGLLLRLVHEPSAETRDLPGSVRIDAAIAAQEPQAMSIEAQPGTLSPFTCPECGGSLWELADGTLLRYRCHVGHALTSDILLTAQAEQIEQRLWALLRTHEERAELVRRMAERERARNRDSLAAQFQDRAEQYEQDAGVIRGLLTGRGARKPSRPASYPDPRGSAADDRDQG